MIENLDLQQFNEIAIPAISANRRPTTVELVDGTSRELNSLSIDELWQLQWEQETAFADLIRQSSKGTQQRTDIIAKAYETVCKILEMASEKQGEPDFVMGLDRRYTNLVLDQLTDLEFNRIQGGLFEVGFGSGVLLDAAATEGFQVGGLEVAEQLFQETKRRLPEEFHKNLCLGNFVDNDRVNSLAGQFSLVYWNDVFEHIPVDEIDCYLSKIHSLLTPGGKLITITPNWHMRPVDITAAHLPPRSTAVGFHLKEYTLGEVCQMLKQAGFSSITTPFFVGRKKIHQGIPFDMTWLKRLIEPTLEWVPYSMAVQCCRRFGFCCTIATK